MASWETIRGNAGISDTSYFTGNAEELSDVKGWLTQQMPPGRIYKPTLNQASLTTHIDMERAIINSRSFRRLCHAVEQLVGAMNAGNVMTTP